MKVINKYKFIRVYYNPSTYNCDVRFSLNKECMFGHGLYLNGFLYINVSPSEFYRVKEKEFGRYPMDIMFRKINLVHPLGSSGGGGKWIVAKK